MFLPSINGVQAISNRIGSVHREVRKIDRNPGNSALTALISYLPEYYMLHTFQITFSFIIFYYSAQ